MSRDIVQYTFGSSTGQRLAAPETWRAVASSGPMEKLAFHSGICRWRQAAAPRAATRPLHKAAGLPAYPAVQGRALRRRRIRGGLQCFAASAVCLAAALACRDRHSCGREPPPILYRGEYTISFFGLTVARVDFRQPRRSERLFDRRLDLAAPASATSSTTRTAQTSVSGRIRDKAIAARHAIRVDYVYGEKANDGRYCVSPTAMSSRSSTSPPLPKRRPGLGAGRPPATSGRSSIR